MFGWALFFLTLSFVAGLGGFSAKARLNPSLSKALFAVDIVCFVLGLALVLLSGAVSG